MRAIAIEPGGARAWLACTAPDALIELDALELEVRAKHALPGAPVGVLALGVDAALVLVNGPRATLARVDAAGMTHAALDGEAVAMQPLAGGRALVVLDDGRWLSIELETLAVAAEQTAPRALAAPAATGDGRKAFVAADDGALWAVDLWNERLRGRVDVGRGARAALVLPDDLEVAVVLEEERALAFVNVAAHELLGRIDCAQVTSGAVLAATPDGRRLFVGAPDARELAIVDLDQRVVLETLPLARGAHSLGVTPDGASLWVGSAGALEVLPLPALAPRPLVAGVRAQTELCVLATIQRAHLTSVRWGMAELRDTIRRIDPDVVCVEVPPDRWQRALLEWRSEGRVDEARVQKLPELTLALLPMLDELEFTVEPCSVWSEELNDLRRTRILAFRSDPELAGQHSAYESEVAEAQRRHAAVPLAGDDPFVLHSDEYDRRAEETMGPFDRYMNDFLGPAGWTNENRAQLALVERAIARHPKSRILFLCSADRRYWFLERLRQRTDLKLLDPRSFLPGAEALPEEIASDAIASFDDLCRAEVLELHRFHEGWMRGELGSSEANLRRFVGALSEEFEHVSLDGTTLRRAELIARVRAEHASHADEDPPFRIWIENLRCTPLAEGLALVTYEEWHEARGERSARVSTALLRAAEHAPAGVSWVHLQETRLAVGGER